MNNVIFKDSFSESDSLKLLYEQNPRGCFVARCWVSTDFNMPQDATSLLCAYEMMFESNEKFEITISSRVLSYGRRIIEKLEVCREISTKYLTKH